MIRYIPCQKILFSNNVYPIVYAYINGVEKFSFVRKMCTEGMNRFLESRKGDVRTNEVNSLSELKEGNIFYITCIDTPKKLMPLYDKYKEKYHCVYQTDIYTNEQWLEIMPLNASKSNAIRQLQSMLNCEKLIVFGDGKNDIDMFQIADKSYAVANAHNDLKQYATEVILSNDEDGVARWLEANYKQQKAKLLSIALENKQVEYILKDEDIHDFYAVICDGTDSEEAKKVRDIMEKTEG